MTDMYEYNLTTKDISNIQNRYIKHNDERFNYLGDFIAKAKRHIFSIWNMDISIEDLPHPKYENKYNLITAITIFQILSMCQPRLRIYVIKTLVVMLRGDKEVKEYLDENFKP